MHINFAFEMYDVSLCIWLKPRCSPHAFLKTYLKSSRHDILLPDVLYQVLFKLQLNDLLTLLTNGSAALRFMSRAG